MDQNQPNPPVQEPVHIPEQATPSGTLPPIAQPTTQEIPQKPINEVKSVANTSSERMERLRAFIQECKRVLRVTKKPDKQEFMTIVKISAAGMGIIGLIGFLIHLSKELLF